MDLHENLKGKTVVITGGSGILCREFAYAYAKQGMNVAVLGRTLSKLEEVCDKINELGGNGLAVVCDVVDKDSVINAKKVVNDTFGKVDILDNPGANVLNIASMSSYHAITKVSAYCAAKAAISNFTEWLAVHFAKSGIRVNALAPGWFETVQNKTLLRNPDGSLSERSKKVLAHTPMGRFGVPEDLTGTLLWLTDSAQSGFVTGATIPVDGGFQAYFGV